MSRKFFAFLWILPIFLTGCAFEQTQAEFSGLAGLSQLWWRPDWRTSLTYTGSGAFSRP
jgi:hypothetical protein